jgi:multidrug resistance protein, MATE family
MWRRHRQERRRIWKLGLPMVVTGYGAVLMLVTDALMVGRLGPEALAAVTPAGLLVGLMLILASETLTAVNTFASTAIGMNEPQQAGTFAWQGIYVAVGFGIVAWAYAPFSEFLFQMLLPNLDARVVELENIYFKISLLTVLPLSVSVAISQFLVACERPKVPMVISIVGVALNAVINAVLIFGWGPIAPMGLAGAAWGTVIASGAQMIALMIFLLGWRDLRVFGSVELRFCREKLRRILKVGFPCGVQGLIDLLSWGVLLSWLIGHFGYKHLAAQTILAACIRFSFAPAAGLGNALATLIGHAQGARNFLLAKRLSAAAFEMVVAYMLTMAVIFLCFRFEIMRAFTDDPEVIALGAQSMILVAAFQYFDAMNVTYINALQGAGDTSWPTAMQIILTAAILVGGGVAMIHYLPHWSSQGVWLVATIYVSVQGLLFRFRWKEGQWRRIRLIESAPEPESI